MRASSTLFTALVAAALVVPSFGAPIEKRAKVCPAKDDSGSALTQQVITDDGLLACSYAAAGGCEYFLGNGNFSSGASTCPDAGLDPGAPGASTGGGASGSAPPPAASASTDPAPSVPAPSVPAPTAPAPTVLPPNPTADTITPAVSTPSATRTLLTTETVSAATPKPTSAAMSRYASHSTALLAGVAVILGAFVL